MILSNFSLILMVNPPVIFDLLYFLLLFALGIDQLSCQGTKLPSMLLLSLVYQDIFPFELKPINYCMMQHFEDVKAYVFVITMYFETLHQR